MPGQRNWKDDGFKNHQGLSSMTVKLCLYAVPAIIPSLDDFLAGHIQCPVGIVIVHAYQCSQCCRTSSFLLLSLALVGVIGLFAARSSTVIHEDRVSWRKVIDIRSIVYVSWVPDIGWLAEARVGFCVAVAALQREGTR